MNLVKYEPLCEVTTFSKKKFYIKKKNRDNLEKLMETNKFVKFGDSIINVASIDTIIPASSEINFIEYELNGLNIDVKNKVKEEIRLYKLNYKKDITLGILKEMIKKHNKKFTI